MDLIFKDTISDYDRQELCTLIYYPREKMALLDEQGKIDSDWYAMTLNELILVAKAALIKVHQVEGQKGSA